MKICLLLQRRFAYIGHQLAVDLKNRYCVNEFCALACTRPSYRFLRSQTEIDYSPLLLEEDIHEKYKTEKIDYAYLDNLEREYGLPNLWPYIEVDRIIRFNQVVREYPYDQCRYSHEELMRMLQVRAKAVIEMLDREKPDFFICSIASGLAGYLLHQIAVKKGVKPLIINFSRLDEYKHLLSDNSATFSYVDEKFSQLSREGNKSDRFAEAEAFLKKFREDPAKNQGDIDFYLKRSNRLEQMDFLLPKNISRYIKWFAAEIKKIILSRQDRYDYSYTRLWGKIKDQTRRKLRNLRGVADLYDAVDLNENFVFFPLHFEPEFALSLFAPFFTDQIYLIKQIAKSLPLTYKLYVKEHPGMVEYRPRKYYQEIKKIPNVRLINAKISGFEIIPKAKLITTITGTAGWEGLLLGKPVITFGEIFYNRLSSVKRCKNIDELPGLIRERLNNFSYDETELLNYLGCIMEESIDLNLEHLWHKEGDQQKIQKDLQPLVDLLAKKMGLTNNKHTL